MGIGYDDGRSIEDQAQAEFSRRKARKEMWSRVEELEGGEDHTRMARDMMGVSTSMSDGSTASYYELPTGCTELQHLISHKNMNAQIGEIFRSCYRYGESSHSTELRDAKKIKFYIDAEIARLEA